MDWTGLDWTGLDWTGLDWTGLDWTGLDWTGLDWSTATPILPRAAQVSVLATQTGMRFGKKQQRTKKVEARNIQMTKSLHRASCLTLEIKKFRCYEAKKFLIISLYMYRSGHSLCPSY